MTLLLMADTFFELEIIAPGAIGIILITLIYDWFLHRQVKKIGIQSLTDEFLKGDIMMNKTEKLVFLIVTLTITFSPMLFLLFFVEKA